MRCPGSSASDAGGADEKDRAGWVCTAQMEKLSEGKPRPGPSGRHGSAPLRRKLRTSARKGSRATLLPGPPRGGGWGWGRGDYEKAEGTSRVRGREKL